MKSRSSTRVAWWRSARAVDSCSRRRSTGIGNTSTSTRCGTSSKPNRFLAVVAAFAKYAGSHARQSVGVPHVVAHALASVATTLRFLSMPQQQQGVFFGAQFGRNVGERDRDVELRQVM